MRPRTLFLTLCGILGVSIIIFGLAYALSSRMLIRERQQFNQKQIDLELSEKRTNQLIELTGRYNEASKKFDEINNALPQSKQQPEVVVQLQNAAGEVGLNLPTIQFDTTAAPTVTQAKDDKNKNPSGLSVLPITIKLSGSYDQLIAYLKKLESLSRYNSVTSINLSKVNSDRKKLDISLTLTAFFKP